MRLGWLHSSSKTHNCPVRTEVWYSILFSPSFSTMAENVRRMIGMAWATNSTKCHHISCCNSTFLSIEDCCFPHVVLAYLHVLIFYTDVHYFMPDHIPIWDIINQTSKSTAGT